jgi:hypothetical protein
MWQPRAFGGGFASAPFYKTSALEIVGASTPVARWDAPLVPILLDVDPENGEWVVVATGDGCDVWVRNGHPRPPYWAFRHRNGAWYRDKIPESFLARAANLLVEYDVSDTSQKLNAQVSKRKALQVTRPKHAKQYSKVDPEYSDFEGCERDAPSSAIGENELDLKNFGTLR